MKRWWAFAPYVLVALAHLAGLVTANDALSSPTKVMLMPALLVAFLVALPTRRTEVALWGTVGILFSWAGDYFLSAPGESGFVTGLIFFMLAHGGYLVLFLRPLRDRRMPRLALLYAIWWAALVILLAPHLGVLLVPVAVYGLVLGTSAAAALGSNRTVALGPLLFLASDTVLAFKLFWPDFALWQADAIIMAGYIAGQGLIALGAIRHAYSGRYSRV